MNVTGCSSLCVKDDNPDIFMGFELCLVVDCFVVVVVVVVVEL